MDARPAAPRFTLLIAAYNAAAFLPECLRSLQAQTERSFQAIAVDDASTDNTLALLRSAAARDARIEVIALAENRGQAAARNAALARARGTYTLMLDADDTLAPDALAQLWHDLHATGGAPADAAVVRLVRTWGERTEGGTARQVQDEVIRHTGGRQHLTGQEAGLLSIDWRLHGLCALRTSLHQRLPFHETPRSYGDDVTARLHYYACREVVLSQGTYYYRQHAASCSAQPATARLNFLLANDLLVAQLAALGVGRKALRRAETYRYRVYVGVWRACYAARHSLTATEAARAHTALAAAFARINPLRVAPRHALHPSTLLLPHYAAFSAWQRALLWLREKCKGHATAQGTQ